MTHETKTPLLVQFEQTIEAADGRLLELHRDDRGGYWIVERRHGRSRTVPLAEYAWECHAAARILRAQQLRLLTARLRYLAGRLWAALARRWRLARYRPADRFLIESRTSR